VKSIAIALTIWFVVQAVLFKSYRIVSSSMEPTLFASDWLFVNKALYGAEIPLVNKRLPGIRGPLTGELIVLEGVEDSTLTIVKRVIGVAGDTLFMRNDSVFRNDEYLPEPYTQHIDPAVQMNPLQRQASRRWQLAGLVDTVVVDRYSPDLRNWGPFVVPDKHVFAMGDNRDSSYDGRHWGFLPLDRIIGTPIFIYWSYDKNHWRPLPFLTAVRWRRLLHAPR
jgi:signal peptidase I